MGFWVTGSTDVLAPNVERVINERLLLSTHTSEALKVHCSTSGKG
jgi:hypothetical protein